MYSTYLLAFLSDNKYFELLIRKYFIIIKYDYLII